MGYRTILVELADDGGLGSRLQVARLLADRFDAVLIGMYVMPPPFIPATYGDAAAYMGPEFIEAQRKANQEIAERALAVFRRICGAEPKAIWQVVEGDRGRLLAEAARATDLVLARRARAESTDEQDVLDGLLSAAGIPVLALPPEISDDLGQTVLAAWDGSREATRAVHGALPFLRAAKRVSLCAVGDEAAASLEAAAAMLQRHGVTVQTHRVDKPDADAGEVLLAQCSAQGADLLVMGAYGHTRLREMVFGGATRRVLREATLPVLFGN